MNTFINLLILLTLMPLSVLSQQTNIVFTMPDESELHEGTWLQWPHEYQYGATYRNRLDPTWVAMTKELVTSEKVHLIVYDETEKDRVIRLLNQAGVPLTDIDFRIYPTDDVWVRDNGPVFVKDSQGKLLIEDWGFNGWGRKTDYKKCDVVPQQIATDINYKRVDVSALMINEGGSVEIDGRGTLMACRSSILNKNRNPNMTQVQAEAIFTKYLGVTHFVWLDGKPGREITDMHIDGFARFANPSTIVTMTDDDLLYWEIPQNDIITLNSATNNQGVPYTFVKIPLTQNNVVTAYGKNLGFKGSYINYYIANKVVLVPNYLDPNDAMANQIIQAMYPSRTVVGIDVRNLYENGGMIHCVTQQQPKGDPAITNTAITSSEIPEFTFQNAFPNPFSDEARLQFSLAKPRHVKVTLYNVLGQEEHALFNGYVEANALQTILFSARDLANGAYFIRIEGHDFSHVQKVTIQK